MNCPTGIRQCPHGWSECSLCANLKACESGTYIPEPEPTPDPNPEPVPELEENELETDLGITIPRERGTWAEQFANMTSDERWADFYKYRASDLLAKEPYKCMSGPTAPGGGGSSGKRHKKPTRKLPEYMKILGM